MIPRILSNLILELSESFKVILLTGPRQVGKTTLFKELSSTHSYVTLDDLPVRMAAIEDPAGFINRLTLPAIIDEVQYAPNLFPYIKLAVDQSKQTGQFWLTGSQQFDMMKNVSESLAGRVAVLQLSGISLAEEQGRINAAPFLPEPSLLMQRQKEVDKLSLQQVFNKIWRGSYPLLVTQEGKHWETFYNSYLTTYIQRDIEDYLGIKNKSNFLKFLQIVAARTAQLVNYADIAANVGVSQVTIKSWIEVLQASGVIYLLQPYFNNPTKRLVKTPKLYFMDTGLCAFLTKWSNPDVLERGAMAGGFLETYVVSEIIKSYYNRGIAPRVYFYRDNKKNEIDLILEENGLIYPLEIKKTATPNKMDYKAFNQLNPSQYPIGHGGVLCFVNQLVPLTDKVDAIPISYI